MTHEPQLTRQGLQELLRRDSLLDELDGFVGHQLGKPHGCGDLDSRRSAGLEDDDASGDRRGNEIERDEHDEDLASHRTAEPKEVQYAKAPRRCRSADIMQIGANGCHFLEPGAFAHFRSDRLHLWCTRSWRISTDRSHRWARARTCVPGPPPTDPPLRGGEAGAVGTLGCPTCGASSDRSAPPLLYTTRVT
jgi:hypothetical protein